ncbi:MAG: PEP-CTERM sorting domain-containing protein, partial [Planctomycetota bacterium]
AWLFDGATTTQISPTGAEFSRADGYRYEDAWYINASGQVAGEATTYVGASTGGKRAWLYTGTTTQVLDGLQGGYFVNANGHLQALPNNLNDAGQVTGTSYRYDGSTGIGLQGWFYDSTTDTTVALGLTDAAYTRVSDDKQYHYPHELSATGLVRGSSDRYDGLFSKGRWVYDWDTDLTYELAFSTKSDGYYDTPKFEFTNDGDGLVGYYEVFDADVSQGYSLFYWTIDRGTDTPVFVDLEDRTTLAAMEDLFALYYKGCGMNSDALFAGTGTMADGSQGAYLLTPEGGIPGDFDDDGDVDTDDIDLLCDNLGDVAYDLDGDGDADEDDFVYLIETLVELTDGSGRTGTQVGDFNLDGLINATDLAIMNPNFGLGGMLYANGNANCDDLINATDLAILAANFGYVAPAGAVPEPITLSLLVLGAAGVLARRRRR